MLARLCICRSYQGLQKHELKNTLRYERVMSEKHNNMAEKSCSKSDRKKPAYYWDVGGDTFLWWMYYCIHLQHMQTRNTADGFTMYRSWKYHTFTFSFSCRNIFQLFLFGWEIKGTIGGKKILKEMYLSSSFEGISMNAAVVQFILMLFIYLLNQ